MKRNLKLILSLVFGVSLFNGCDMGTYEERFEKRIDNLREDELPENQPENTADTNDNSGG